MHVFQDAGQDAPSLERLDVMWLSIDQAIAYPLLGYAYIEPATGNYPHNLLVESALARGIGGFVLMLCMQLSLFWNSLKITSRGAWLLPFLAAAMFANAWKSGALWGSGLFFMLVWLVRDRRAYSIQSVAAKRSATPHGLGGQ